MEIILFFIKSYLAVWIGLFIHTATKYNTVRVLHVKSNADYTFKQFIREDVMGHLINVACCILWMLLFRDLVDDHPTIKAWMWIGICAGVGFFNSLIVLAVFNAGYKKALKIIDEKTNIADGK